ncbi:UNVERIFIED_CONTAM: hypothetical protein Sradi_4015900 [Sesamum radiatum]|uniref:BED-type domain-containing protein n=1 Tax=Sesamum radiatum TaxID=300843 RepID=A0AAW2PKF6_SESRA
MSSTGQNTDTSSSNPISAPSQRGKTDVTWNHVVERLIDGKKVICCMYCGKVSTGGGIIRMKQHLAGKKGKDAVKKAHLEVAKFFYDTCIPINACNSRYFQCMFDVALAIGPGCKVPTYHELRLPLLKDAKKEVQLWVDNIRSIWAHCGCTIMGDGWTDNRNRTLINFLIYCPRGTIFWESVDASDIVKDAQALFNLFQEVIEWVGPTNVVHMIADNGANYVAAGRKVQDHYKSISWSPCAANCLNLVMKDIAKLDHVVEIVNKVFQVTRFVYNHVYWLSWLWKRKDWTEIIRPAFQYEQASFCQKPEVMNGVLEVITTKGIGSKSKLLHETRLFRDRLESFGQELALETSKNTQPDEWWKLFGASAPNLQQLAIRILGQTSSSSGCERNWSVFEYIHTKKRNRLEHQRLNDLVYVHYNLKLKDRWFMKAESYDPIDYENITDCIEDIEDVEDLEIDDDIDFSAFDQFNLEDNLHDVSVGVGEGSSSSGGAFLGDDAWCN